MIVYKPTSSMHDHDDLNFDLNDGDALSTTKRKTRLSLTFNQVTFKPLLLIVGRELVITSLFEEDLSCLG